MAQLIEAGCFRYGTRLFCVDGLDGRSQTARRFRDLVETIGNDLGGVDNFSEGQKQLRAKDRCTKPNDPVIVHLPR
jgi:hypothetical protein